MLYSSSANSQVQSLPGILIFRFVAPLCYVNAMVFRTRLVTAAGVDPALALTEEVDGCLMVGFKKVHMYIGVVCVGVGWGGVCTVYVHMYSTAYWVVCVGTVTCVHTTCVNYYCTVMNNKH